MDKLGANFVKADLHIHTPASGCYKNKTISVEAIIDQAISAQLDVIAITDHNDIASIDDARNYAKGKNILVFPGIEITAKGGHILAIFNSEYPIARLGDLLSIIGITSDKRGKEDALGDEIEVVLEKINEFGGIAIAAHADDNNGFLETIPQGTLRIRIYSNKSLGALELLSKENIKAYSNGLKTKYERKIACIQSSDAHDITEVGRRFSYLKMDEVSLEGLRQALLDHEIKIKCMDENISSDVPSIAYISANKGFFEDEKFGFHPNLNCIIGGRGTGKSLLVELIRFAFEDVPSIEEIREDHFGKIRERLGDSGKITLACRDRNGEEYLIEREYDSFNEFDAKARITNKSTGVETTFPFKPFFFSQGEIARISTFPIAQLELIDKYIDISDENAREQTILSAMEENSSALQGDYEKLVKVDRILKDETAGKAVTDARLGLLRSGITEPILREFPQWEEERDYLDKLYSGVGAINKEILENLEEIDSGSYFPSNLERSSPNFKLINTLSKIIEEINLHFGDIKKKINEISNKKQEEIKEAMEQLAPHYEKKKREYDEYLRTLGVESIKKIQNEILSLQSRKALLQGKDLERQRTAVNYEKEKKQRKSLISDLRKAREERHKKRINKSKQLEIALNKQINIDIIKNGDRREYLTRLSTLATGSMVRDKDLAKIVDKIEPDDLGYLVLRGEAGQIATQATIDQDWASRLVSHLKAKRKEEVLNLQSVELNDLPVIRFKLDQDHWRPLSQCSIGQKSTVILSMVLTEGEEPIIIDQPEDALDTVFIYEMIVKKLRKEKEARQYILTTHNPNILVSADSDLSIILEASAERGKVRSRGGLDKLETNELVLLHLEGGANAFQLRGQKYTRLKPNS